MNVHKSVDGKNKLKINIFAIAEGTRNKTDSSSSFEKDNETGNARPYITHDTWETLGCEDLYKPVSMRADDL